MLAAGILISTPYLHAQSIVADSKIISATVYTDSALITRSAQIALNEGMNQVEFNRIIPEINEHSLTVSGKGTAEAKIHGAFIKRDYGTETPDERAAMLNKQLEEINDKINNENNHIQTIQSQKEFLKSVTLYSKEQLPKELTTKMPAVQELDGLVDFVGNKNVALDQKRSEIDSRLRDLYKQKTVIEQELNELQSSGSQMNRSIVVNVECLIKGTMTIEVSYLVSDVYWYSIYDARADMNKNEVELTSYGVVKQTTGEDWKDISLALSTAKPSISGQIPYIAPWIVRPYQPPVPMKARRGMAKANVAQEMVAGVQYEPNYLEADMSAPGAEEVKTEMAVSQVDTKGISVSYQMPGKVTVKSDGTDHKLPISSQTLEAKFSYTTYPRLSPYAYLGTRVANAPDLQLLAGPINVFLDGDYVGESNIQNIGPGEVFDLSLGIDESVKVERKEIEKKVDDVLIAGISSGSKKTSTKYKLSVENYKGKPIDVILYEAMPVSENDRIKVKVSDVSLEPKEKDWDSRKGVWRWELKLDPKAKKEIAYSFFIEHPREMEIE